MWDRIAKDILQLHLTSGYGPAWGANSITVATAGKATVRPVALQDGGLIAPYVCGMSDPSWYGSYADFLVLNTDGTSALQPSREQVVRSFGSPAGGYSLVSYGDLLVWNHDITPQLSRPDECAWAP